MHDLRRPRASKLVCNIRKNNIHLLRFNHWLRVFTLSVIFSQSAFAEDIWYFPSTNNEHFEGLLWLSNLSAESSELEITAIDDAAAEHEPIAFTIDGLTTLEISASLLEEGSEEVEFEGLGKPAGDWRLSLKSELSLEVFTYVRSSDLLLVPMHAVSPSILNRHRLPNFRVANGTQFRSQLRIVNNNEHEAKLTLEATSIDASQDPISVSLEIPAEYAYQVNTLAINEESPSPNLSCEQTQCTLTMPSGVWELKISSSSAVTIMHLGLTEAGQISNLSSQPQFIWRELVVTAEARCADEPYSRSAYGTRYRTKESDIQESLGAIFSPYTGECFDSLRDTEIEHMVALAEAHESGMCHQDDETKRTLGGDLRNLTLADSTTNRAKSSKDAFDWLPAQNKCWFADRVLTVKREYGMTIDKDEAERLEDIVTKCESFELEIPACAQ